MKNILLDADAMYPEGFHPASLKIAADYSSPAKYRSRTSAGAKCYYVGFSISVYAPDPDNPQLVIGTLGIDQDPPELSEDVPYNPFSLDICIIGNMFAEEFYQVSVP